MPKHVAIICDGNRRWAKARRLPILAGHRQALITIRDLVKQAGHLGIECLTLWVFSTENWQRPPAEVKGLMGIFTQYFNREAELLHQMGVRIQHIGNLQPFPADIKKAVRLWEKNTQHNSGLTLNLAVNYGGRDELVRAVRKLAKASRSLAQLGKLTAQQLSDQLDTRLLPDPDLVIRAGGESRLSGFLPWQSVYAELYFSPVLFPDFTGEKLREAIEWFKSRQRRFGC